MRSAINAPPATIDRDVMAATDTTTNQNAETTTVEATVGGDASATSVEQRRKRGHGKGTTTTKIDATTAIDATTVSIAKKLKRITSIVATQVVTTTRSSTVSTRTWTATTILPCSSHQQNWRPRQNAAALSPIKKRQWRASANLMRQQKPSKKVVESNSDKENDDNENFLALCGKVLDRDPLNI